MVPLPLLQALPSKHSKDHPPNPCRMGGGEGCCCLQEIPPHQAQAKCASQILPAPTRLCSVCYLVECFSVRAHLCISSVLCVQVSF